MKKFNIRNLLIVPAVLTLAFAVALPAAFADHGNSDAADNGAAISANETSSNSTDGASSSHGSDSASTDSSSNDSSGGVSTEAEQQAEDSVHQEADSLIQKLEGKRHTAQSQTARTKKCQAAQHGLETKLGNLQKNAAKHKALIDKVYSEALAYQQQNNLNPANFTDLVNTANADQAKAAQSVAALDNLSVNLDCTSSTVATNVAAFKVAAQQARSDLLAYRNSVRAVLQALESAKQ